MYEIKEKQYFSNIRYDLLKLIPKNNKGGHILEIGAGSGDTLMYAKKNSYADKITGIELMEMSNSYQQSEEFDNFMIGNIEELTLEFKAESFDVIIFGDVLEHLINPYDILEKLKPYLKGNGVIIASIPNIRYFNVLKEIIFFGDFKYTDSGILDKTHLRFFCKKNMIDMFHNADYSVIKVMGSIKISGMRPKLNFLNKITFRIFEDFFNKQYFLVVEKNG